ncbi:hypothetical protein, partial [Streptomyces sp. DSM 41493]
MLASIASPFQRGEDDMCNCSEHESRESLATMPAASVEPAMNPQVPLSWHISFSDDESGDQTESSDLRIPIPPFK